MIERDKDNKWVVKDGSSMDVLAAHKMNMAENGELVSCNLNQWGHRIYPLDHSVMVTPQEKARREELVSLGIAARTSRTHSGVMLDVKYE